MRSGSAPGTRRRSTTAATTSPTTATSTPASERSPMPRSCSRPPTSTAIQVIVDLVPNHTSSEHPWFKAALAAPARFARAGALHLPRRQGQGRERATHQLDVGVRRLGMGAGRRWSVVPAPVRPHPTRSQLGERGGAGRVRRHLPVLARPRGRRVPDRRRPRPRQGPGLSRHRRRRRQAAREQPPPEPSALGPRRRPRDQPALAGRARRVRARRDDGRRGLGRPDPPAALPPPRRVPPVVQLRLPRDGLGDQAPSRRRSIGPSPRPATSDRPRHGRCRTTT